jgi:hypothetical protein
VGAGALADVSGAGRYLVADIAETLKKEGLLEPDQCFENVDQMLDGFERTAGRLAEAVNTPPLDVETLRREWTALRAEAGQIPRALLPSPLVLRGEWQELKQEAAAQERTVFELSTIMAVSAIRRLPENVRWLSRAAGIGARRTRQVVAAGTARSLSRNAGRDPQDRLPALLVSRVQTVPSRRRRAVLSAAGLAHRAAARPQACEQEGRVGSPGLARPGGPSIGCSRRLARSLPP